MTVSADFEAWTRRALALLARGDRPLDVLEWAGAEPTPGLAESLPPGSRWVTLEPRADAARARTAAPGVERLFFVPPGDASRAAGYAVFPAQLGRTFDLVVVRGAARASCTQIGCMLLAPTGVLLLDRDGDPDAAAPMGALALNGSGAHVAVVAPDAQIRAALEALAHAPVAVTPRGRAIMFNTYYPAFLAAHYRAHPGLDRAPYAEQLASLQGRLFGDSDFYSAGLRAAGWAADDVIVNCDPLQRAWARENGFAADRSPLEIAVEQIRRARPDVVYIQDLGLATQPLLAALRPHCELLVGQIASPISPQTHYPSLDVVVTSFPHFVKRFRDAGVCAYHQPLAFEPRVLDRVGVPSPGAGRPHPLTFVGGLSRLHTKGNAFLDLLARKLPIEFWGYGADELPPDSPIRPRHHGEAWGDDMFRLLGSSAITVNRHVDVAETNANNMRLFEATGCGALLVTDHKDNLDDLFEIGREVVAYRSPEECVALVEYYLAHPAEATRIAAAGQARTLRDHTYAARMRDTADFLDAHLRRKRRAARGPTYVPGAVSTGHVPLAPEAVTPALIDAWKDAALPARQRALVDGELREMYRGPVPPLPFDVLRAALAPLVRAGDSVLEIGCSSGYYAEVLRYLLHQPLDFTGVDYSPAMIAMARAEYPTTKFLVADGANLPFPDRSFDVAISSSVLLHVRDYPLHVAETTRVARNVVVAHRIPVCRRRPTTFLKKRGYDIEMMEIVFNERELLDLFLAAGLELVDGLQYHADDAADTFGVTYVFRKR